MVDSIFKILELLYSKKDIWKSSTWREFCLSAPLSENGREAAGNLIIYPQMDWNNP